MKNQEFIYRVAFVAPPLEGDPRIAFYFSSLAAIYDVFSVEQVGVALKTLWNRKVADGCSFFGELATITREPLFRKAQQNPQSSTRGARSLDSSSEV